MRINLKAEVIGHKEAGVFIDDNGKKIEYGAKSCLMVFLADQKYPEKVFVKGQFPLGMGTLVADLTVNKEQFVFKPLEFKLGA